MTSVGISPLNACYFNQRKLSVCEQSPSDNWYPFAPVSSVPCINGLYC